MGAWGPPTIAGYDGLAPVGSHGAAELYRDHPGDLVAVWPITLPDEPSRRRFARDTAGVTVLAAHPNIVGWTATGFCSDGRPYAVFPPEVSAAGGAVGTLSSALRGTGPLVVADVLRVGLVLAGAVETAHRIGELHRGIEPDCVLLSAAGEPLLADFGMALVLEALAVGMPSAAIPPRLRYFTAPEVLERRAASPAADVYSLGATLYALLAGRAPHGAGLSDPPDSAPALLLRTLRNEIPPIDRPDVPESLTEILHAALAVDPAARIPTAVALAQALQDVQVSHRFEATPVPILDLTPPSATPPPPPAPSPAPPPPPPPPPEEPREEGVRGPDTLTDFWPDEMGQLGPNAGAATSAVWVAPIPSPTKPPPPPPVEVEDSPPANVVFEPVVEPAESAPEEAEPPPDEDLAPVAPISPPPPPAPAPPPAPPPSADLPEPPTGAPAPRSGKTMLVLGALVLVAVAAAAATTFVLQPEDEPGGEGRTTTTAEAEADVEVPTGLTASESPAGVQLDWDGDEAATYAVLVMSEAAAPKVLSADAGPSLLVPMAEIAPDVGYCFAVADVTTVEATTNDIATAFSNPTCIRGASEDTVQGS